MDATKNALSSKTVISLLVAFFIQGAEALQSADPTDYATVALILGGIVFRVYATHRLSVKGGGLTLK